MVEQKTEDLERSANPLESRRPRGAHWKPALAAVGAVLALALLMGLATGAVQEALDVAAGPPRAVADEPPQQVIDACNSYAARADNSIVLEEDVAAGGAEAREERAGSGVAAGTFFGMSEENRQNEAARIAYGACMERRGY